MIKGGLKIDFSKQIDSCIKDIDGLLDDADYLELSEAQKISISNIVYGCIEDKFDDFNVNIFGESDD